MCQCDGIRYSTSKIYPRKRIKDGLKLGAVPGTMFRCTSNGWINQNIFLEWFSFFISSIPLARPVLLILDGHSSHMTVEVIEMAQNNGIHMLCLPSHCTHILQPLDVGVFKSLKVHYSRACKDYLSTHPGQVITTDVLASLIAKAWQNAITPVNIMSGFRKCGIYPLNRGQISDRQLQPS